VKGLECDGEGRITVFLRGGGYLRALRASQVANLAQHCCTRALTLADIEYVESFGWRIDWCDWTRGLLRLVQEGRKARAQERAYAHRRGHLAAALVRAVAAAASMKAAFA